MKKFETLKAGLGNGLICRYKSLHTKTLLDGKLAGVETDVTYESFSFLHGNNISNIMDGMVHLEDIKPHLFPFSHLAKPIRVEGYNDGKEFTAKDYISEKYELSDYDDQIDYILEDERCITTCDYLLVKELQELHFNTEVLPPSDFIDASVSKVYEPK